MTALVINAGPVNGPGASPRPGDIGQVDWTEKPDILTINGNGSSHFAALAAQWTKNGHILPQLLAAHGRSIDMYSSISVTGFSAGHGLFDPLLLLDGDNINAAVLFDSCFTLQSTPNTGKNGYAEFGARAIHGDRLMVMTSSHGQNGPGLPPSRTGSDCALASFDHALALTGASDTIIDPPPGIPTTNPKGNFYQGPGELQVHNAGLFYVLDYGPLYYHGDHINLLSRDVLSTFLVPYLSGQPLSGNEISSFENSGDSGSGGSSGLGTGEILLLAAAAGAAVIALRTRSL